MILSRIFFIQQGWTFSTSIQHFAISSLLTTRSCNCQLKNQKLFQYVSLDRLLTISVNKGVEDSVETLYGRLIGAAIYQIA